MGVFNKERPLTPSWDLVKPSVKLLQTYFWQVAYLSFIPGLLITVGLTFMGVGEKPVDLDASRMGLGALLAVIGGIWALLAIPGFTYLQLRAAEGQDVSAMESFRKGLPRLPAYIGMAIVAAILVLLGLVAVIIPGLLLIRGFLLAPYYLVGQNLGPIEALKKSYNESVHVSGWIWGLIGVQLVFGLVGSILGNLPVIGVVISLVISYLYVFAPALRYSEMTQNLKVKTSAVEDTPYPKTSA